MDIIIVVGLLLVSHLFFLVIGWMLKAKDNPAYQISVPAKAKKADTKPMPDELQNERLDFL